MFEGMRGGGGKMFTIVNVVYVVLIVLTAAFLVCFIRDFIVHKKELEQKASWIKSGVLGFITNFLDVLGIGSFAPTTAGLRLLKQTDDRLIPGTLNVGCTIPVVMEALLFIKAIEVEPVTLVALLAAATIGSFLGAGIVSKLPDQPIRLIMGFALFLAAFLMIAGKFKWMPGGGEAVGLTGTKLVIGIAVNFILGALMTAGIGLYAPCMALVYFLGMSPAVAFPIMMGSCAFLMPVASFKFLQTGAYSRKPSMAITIFGAVGVVIAVYIVKSLPLDILRWLVIGVLLYTSITLTLTYIKNRKAAA
jgi:uncharacterized membrane protein YfcA